MSIVTTTAPSAFDKAEFEFHEPELRISDWGFDPISPDNGCILMESADFKGKTLKDVYHDMAVPIVVFTAKCWQEIQYLTNKYPHQEWAVFLTMKKLDSHRPHFLAFDWFMPGQQASGGAVSVQAADSIKYYDHLLEKYPYYNENGVHKFLCHLHSHHSMAMPSFSSIDDNQQKSRDDLGFYDDYRFYIVVTCNSGLKASMVSYNPAFVRTNAAVAITWSSPEYVEELSKKRKAEIDAIAEKALFKPPVTATAVTPYRYKPTVHKKDSPWQPYDYTSDDWTAWRYGYGYDADAVLPKVEWQAPAAKAKTGLELIEMAPSTKDITDFIKDLVEMFKENSFEHPCVYEGELNELYAGVLKELNLDVTLDEDTGRALKGFCRFFLECGASAEVRDIELVADILCCMAQLSANRKFIAKSEEAAVKKYLEDVAPYKWDSAYELLVQGQDTLKDSEYYEELFNVLTWFMVRPATEVSKDDEEYEAYEGYRVEA